MTNVDESSPAARQLPVVLQFKARKRRLYVIVNQCEASAHNLAHHEPGVELTSEECIGRHLQTHPQPHLTGTPGAATALESPECAVQSLFHTATALKPHLFIHPSIHPSIHL